MQFLFYLIKNKEKLLLEVLIISSTNLIILNSHKTSKKKALTKPLLMIMCDFIYFHNFYYNIIFDKKFHFLAVF